MEGAHSSFLFGFENAWFLLIITGITIHYFVLQLAQVVASPRGKNKFFWLLNKILNKENYKNYLTANNHVKTAVI